MGRTHIESVPRLVITLYHHHFFCQVKLFNAPIIYPVIQLPECSSAISMFWKVLKILSVISATPTTSRKD